VQCHPPQAIFADVPTLCNAPKAMIAAGFGDMLGKYTALADWKLAHIIMNDPYQETIAKRVEKALHLCIETSSELIQADPLSITHVMDGLVESGVCMALAGNSRPASGSEHHVSHYWEMLLLQQGRPAVLHGVKVGIGTILIAKRWEQIRCLSRADVERRLMSAQMPNSQKEKDIIKAAYPVNCEAIISGQSAYLSMSNEEFARLKTNILGNWAAINETASAVPAPEIILSLLKKVSAPTRVEEIGLNSQDESNALRYAHYLRSQFTVSKLGKLLELWE